MAKGMAFSKKAGYYHNTNGINLLLCGYNSTKMKDKIIGNIKTIRESKNYTEAYMAEKLGITQGAYNRKENGDLEFNITELVTIGAVLEVPVGRLVELDLQKIINNPQSHDYSTACNGFIEHYTNNSNDEGYKTALAQCQGEISFLRAQVEKLTDALAGKA
jgi:transcriptional regulator with XRE-family HTH domain